MDAPQVAVGIDERIAVLREMIRITENWRDEQLQTIERINQYNLALVAFSGAFLSLLITAQFSRPITEICGLCLLVSIAISLLTVRPMRMKFGAVVIDNDVEMLRNGEILGLHDYLLDVADLTNQVTHSMDRFVRVKKKWTIYSAIFLALALVSTYTLYVYAA